MATLLIVDDDNLIRETLHELLSGAHECHTADRAEQALAFLDVETYDVVLTDLSMPGLNGRELLRYVHAKHTNTPVIVISGDVDEGKANEMINAGAFAYFAKPFNLDDIELAVIRAISRRQELTGQQSEQSQPSPADTGAAK